MPVGKAEVRLVARNNEILATRKTDECRPCAVRGGAGARRGRPVAGDADGHEREGRLRLPQPEDQRLRPDRPRRCRAGRCPSGADAFVYAERGVYRSSETVYLTALLRDGQGNAVAGGPLTLVIERPDGVEFRRAVLPDQGAGGRSADRCRSIRPSRPGPGGCAPSPIRRARRSAKPPSWSRITSPIGSNSTCPPRTS